MDLDDIDFPVGDRNEVSETALELEEAEEPEE